MFWSLIPINNMRFVLWEEGRVILRALHNKWPCILNTIQLYQMSRKLNIKGYQLIWYSMEIVKLQYSSTFLFIGFNHLKRIFKCWGKWWDEFLRDTHSVNREKNYCTCDSYVLTGNIHYLRAVKSVSIDICTYEFNEVMPFANFFSKCSNV